MSLPSYQECVPDRGQPTCRLMCFWCLLGITLIDALSAKLELMLGALLAVENGLILMCCTKRDFSSHKKWKPCKVIFITEARLPVSFPCLLTIVVVNERRRIVVSIWWRPCWALDRKRVQYIHIILLDSGKDIVICWNWIRWPSQPCENNYQ